MRPASGTQYSVPMSLADVRSEYARLAPRYDRRWARYIARTARETLAEVRPKPGQRVLDAGCGSGALLEALLSMQPGVRAAGLDASDAMLAVARERLPSAVALSVGDVHAMPFTAASFDIVVSASSFHYWQDKPQALHEVSRVLSPGGLLVLTDWCDDFLACRVCDRILRVVDRAHAPIAGRAECEGTLRDAGFDAPTIRRFRVGWLWGMMTARARKPTATGQLLTQP
ncbi:MAG: methyltransferase domain-containing protein [Casimicrobiaceae bacterium]